MQQKAYKLHSCTHTNANIGGVLVVVCCTTTWNKLGNNNSKCKVSANLRPQFSSLSAMKFSLSKLAAKKLVDADTHSVCGCVWMCVDAAMVWEEHDRGTIVGD